MKCHRAISCCRVSYSDPVMNMVCRVNNHEIPGSKSDHASEMEDCGRRLTPISQADTLIELSTITNSSIFRDNDHCDPQALNDVITALSQLVDARVACSMSELKFVKELGQGSFARVDLYQFKDGRQPPLAVKRMKEK